MKLLKLIAASVAAYVCLTASAQTFPSRPIKLVNPYPAGGAADTVARLLAQELSPRLGQPVVVENPAGAGGIIGTAHVARADADGYTLLLANTGNLSINPWLYKQTGYDSIKDFAPIAMIGATDLVLVAGATVPVANVQELLRRYKANPQLPCAHAGNGTINHLSLAVFKAATGIQCTEVPYKGAAPAIADLLAGHVEIFFATIPSVLSQIEAGKLKALGTLGSKRTANLPNVPTLNEAGVPRVELNLWFGVLAPSKTPSAVVSRLEKAVEEVLADKEVQQKLARMSVDPLFMPASAFANFLSADLLRWRTAVERSGATLQ